MKFRMKWFVLFAVLFVVPVVSAAEPTELAQARAAYEAQVRVATEPIRQRYIRQLEDMKIQMSARGKATDAVVVQDEINKLRQMSGMSLAFDWQKLRSATSYSYLEPLSFAQSVGYKDVRHTKLLDGVIGDTYSENSVGWQKTAPSPILIQFNRPLQPGAIRLYFLGSAVRGGVEMPAGVKVYSAARAARGELIGERSKLPDRSGWVDIPLQLRTPLDRIRVEIEPSGTGWTILEEVEFK